MASLVGKVIAMTGAASGIGLSAARLLASRGAVLSLADVQTELLNEAAMSIRKDGGQCITFVVDVRDGKMVDAWIEQTVEKFGRLDGAVNCAGVSVFPLTVWNKHKQRYWDGILMCFE